MCRPWLDADNLGNTNLDAKGHHLGIKFAGPQSLPRKGLSNDDQVANTRIAATTERASATAPSERLRLRRRIRVPHRAALDHARGDIIFGKNGFAMNHFVTPGFVLLVVALVLALDATLALKLSSG